MEGCTVTCFNCGKKFKVFKSVDSVRYETAKAGNKANDIICETCAYELTYGDNPLAVKTPVRDWPDLGKALIRIKSGQVELEYDGFHFYVSTDELNRAIAILNTLGCNFVNKAVEVIADFPAFENFLSKNKLRYIPYVDYSLQRVITDEQNKHIGLFTIETAEARFGVDLQILK